MKETKKSYKKPMLKKHDKLKNVKGVVSPF